MQDRFHPNFSERIRQSEVAKIANLEAFRRVSAAETSSTVGIPYNLDFPCDPPKPLLGRFPEKLRYRVLAATAGLALGVAACGGQSRAGLTPDTDQQAAVLGANVTPVPSVSETALAPTSTSNNAEYIAEGQKIGDFVLNGPYGSFRSSDAIGKPMLLFYCCNQADLEAKTINDLKNFYGRQLLVLPIIINGSLNNKVGPFYVEDPYDVQSTNHMLMVSGTPFVVAISRDRTVVDERGGDDYLVNIDTLAQKLIAGSDITPSDTLSIDESKVGIPLQPYDSSMDLASISRVTALLYQSGQTTPEEAKYISSTIAQADQTLKTFGEQQKGLASLQAIAPVGRKLADIYCRGGNRQEVYNMLRQLTTYATRTYERYVKVGLADSQNWDSYAANFVPSCGAQYPTDN